MHYPVQSSGVSHMSAGNRNGKRGREKYGKEDDAEDWMSSAILSKNTDYGDSQFPVEVRFAHTQISP